MQFNSFVFILLFLPLTVSLYYILNKINIICGKIVLLLASIVFYCYTDFSLFLVLGISLGINYIFSLLITRCKKWNSLFIFIPIAVNTLLLLYYKYSNFAISNINSLFNKEIALIELVLPIGISFFTFQQIAYIVAVFKGELKINLLDYLVFILYFPKILMGPLMEPVDFINQLQDTSLKKFDIDKCAEGIKIFSLGLFKKVMIADVFAKAVGWGYSNIDTASSLDWLLIMLFYTFEIYFDFSGYSDMAVGSSLFFNIKLPINFDSPYKAVSIRDFWKRWHISLTKFFTKYIYIPLGGSRRGLLFTCLNTMIVFSISGLWHGASWTFVLWGLLHGLFSVIDRLFDKTLRKICEPAKWLYTFVIINVLWLLFRSDTIGQWFYILKKIIYLDNLTINQELIDIFHLPEMPFLTDVFYLQKISGLINGFWMFLYIFSAYNICLLFENNYRAAGRKNWYTMVIAALAFVWGIICLSEESVFVYFNF